MTYTSLICLSGFFFLVKVLVEKIEPIGNFLIFQGDYRNMYPFNEHSEINDKKLEIINLMPAFICIGYLILLLLGAITFDKFGYKYNPKFKTNWKLVDNYNIFMVYFCLFSYLCLTCTMMFNQIIKNMVRIANPNFFHMCDYKQINSNYTYYLENVKIGEKVDLLDCYNYDLIDRSISSFPSSYSSYMLSMALSFFNCIKHSKLGGEFQLLPVCLFFSSFYIGIVEISDYYNSVTDVLFGYFLAICIYILSDRIFSFFTLYILKECKFIKPVKKKIVRIHGNIV